MLFRSVRHGVDVKVPPHVYDCSGPHVVEAGLLEASLDWAHSPAPPATVTSVPSQPLGRVTPGQAARGVGVCVPLLPQEYVSTFAQIPAAQVPGALSALLQISLLAQSLLSVPQQCWKTPV